MSLLIWWCNLLVPWKQKWGSGRQRKAGPSSCRLLALFSFLASSSSVVLPPMWKLLPLWSQILLGGSEPPPAPLFDLLIPQGTPAHFCFCSCQNCLVLPSSSPTFSHHGTSWKSPGVPSPGSGYQRTQGRLSSWDPGTTLT